MFAIAVIIQTSLVVLVRYRDLLALLDKSYRMDFVMTALVDVKVVVLLLFAINASMVSN